NNPATGRLLFDCVMNRAPPVDRESATNRDQRLVGRRLAIIWPGGAFRGIGLAARRERAELDCSVIEVEYGQSPDCHEKIEEQQNPVPTPGESQKGTQSGL